MLIGLTGPAGCGKSTVAQMLRDLHAYREFAFADPLKDMLAALLGCTRGELDDELRSRKLKEMDWDELAGRSPRYALQSLGTEWGRNLMHPDLWVRALENRLPYVDGKLQTGNGIVISDVRFENEAKFIRANGRLVHIFRPTAGINTNHVSERGIAFQPGDLHLRNDGDMAALQREIDKLIWRRELTAPAVTGR